MCNVTRENMSESEFRFAVIPIWYAMFRKTNGRMKVLHYPVNKQTHHRRSLAVTTTSPRKGTHNIQRISSEDTSSKDQRLKCPGDGFGIFADRDQRSIFLGFESRMSVFFLGTGYRYCIFWVVK